MSRWLLRILVAAAPVLAALAVLPATAQQPGTQVDQGKPSGQPVETAPVVMDGRSLFELRGASAFPAAQRAAEVSARIKAIAADASFDPSSLTVETSPIGIQIKAGDTRILLLVEADAEREEIALGALGDVVRTRIRQAIESYRSERSAAVVKRAMIHAGVALVTTALLVVGFLIVTRLLIRFMERRYKRRIEALKIQSFQLVRTEQIFAILQGFLHLLRTVVVVAMIYLCAVYVLNLFVWTRPLGRNLVDYLVGPVEIVSGAMLDSVPNLVFIAIIFLLARISLRLTQVLFRAIEFGYVRFTSFEREWARPTYKLVRLAILAFALVVAYPYIPGSSSAAFQAVSIFAGVILSLGSSSIISNMIAGYSMIYRRAFAVGDWIQVGQSFGEVMDIRLLVTHLRSPKNESVVIPSSQILSCEVVNYSALAKQRGLLLHTSVGIGYEVPWRQVEAMLIEAARRTEGLRREPLPFVLEKSLGDFAIIYELNAPCETPAVMPALYAKLHRNILDVFNEHGVQIMTPNYRADPETPKLVPKEHWYDPPAQAVSAPTPD